MASLVNLSLEDKNQVKSCAFSSCSEDEFVIDAYCNYDAESLEDYYNPSRKILPMETVYEAQEEAWGACSDDESDDVVMVMNFAYSSDEQSSSPQNPKSGCSMPALGNSKETLLSLTPTSDALRESIHDWTVASGVSASVTVFVGNRTFKLHKAALEGKSGLFKRMLRETKLIHLSEDCCGGPEIFEIVAYFCYGGTVVLQPSNVGVLKCAAEYMEMVEEHARGNLSQKCDVFLSHVALQSWAGSMAVLHQCQRFLTMAESLLLPTRCIDSLAFYASMDVERGRSCSSIDRTPSSDVSSRTADPFSDHLWWIDDVASLPFNFFIRFVVAVRKTGMEEKYISESIEKYVKKWIFQDENFVHKEKQSYLLEAVVRLLPQDSDDVRVSFLLSLLHAGLVLDVSSDCITKLETRISSQLHRATVEDIVLPAQGLGKEGCSYRTRLDSMQHIFRMFMSQNEQIASGCLNDTDSIFTFSAGGSPKCLAVAVVSKLWDEYLGKIALEPGISASEFCELVNTIHSYGRISHDWLYKALHNYLKTHPHISQAERHLVCRPLDCRKLSQKTCIDAVQNDLLPLRMIVQAMFMHQLQRFTVDQPPPTSEASGDSMPSSRRIASSNRRTSSSNLYLYDDPCSSSFSTEEKEPQRESVLPKKESSLKDEFEAAKTRLRELEEEMAKIKRNLLCDPGTIRRGSDQLQAELIDKSKEKTFMSRSSCISHIWDSHRMSRATLTQRLSKAFHNSFRMLNLLKGRSCHMATDTHSILGHPTHDSHHKQQHPSRTVAKSNAYISATTDHTPIKTQAVRRH